MCDRPGFIHRQIISAQCDRAEARHEQKIRQEAIRGALGQQPKRETLTEKAQTMLIVVGGIVLLGSASLVIRILAVTLAVIAGLLVGAIAAAVVVGIRRRRSQRPLLPAPLPGAPARTVITAVSKRAIGPARPASTPSALGRSRSAGRR